METTPRRPLLSPRPPSPSPDACPLVPRPSGMLVPPVPPVPVRGLPLVVGIVCKPHLTVPTFPQANASTGPRPCARAPNEPPPSAVAPSLSSLCPPHNSLSHNSSNNSNINNNHRSRPPHPTESTHTRNILAPRPRTTIPARPPSPSWSSLHNPGPPRVPPARTSPTSSRRRFCAPISWISIAPTKSGF
jgi:hypothetical protein